MSRGGRTMTMRAFMGYLLIGVLAVLSMALATVTGLGLSAGARPMPERGAIIQHVDRTHKGDRLDVPATVRARTMPKQEMTLPEGCEPVFSPLSTGLPSISGRCLS
jgi:hypothetical protein